MPSARARSPAASGSMFCETKARTTNFGSTKCTITEKLLIFTRPARTTKAGQTLRKVEAQLAALVTRLMESLSVLKHK